MPSPWKSAVDSPSRQLLWELSQLNISKQENFYARLDRESREREKIHKQALAAAAVEHARIREGAEQARRELDQQILAERERREDEQRREYERNRQERAEQALRDKKLTEEARAKATQLEALAAAEDERILKAEAETAAQVRKAKKEREELEASEKARKAKQNAELQRRLAEAKAAQQKPATAIQNLAPAPVTKPQPPTTAPPPVTAARTTPIPEREAEHQRHLSIHKKLKELRKSMIAEAAKSPDLKKHMGDMRREIRKSVGQLRVGQGMNKQPLQNIIITLRNSLQIPCPQIPISPFLASPPPACDGTPTTGPSLLLYLLNIFSKTIITQLVSEAGIDTAKADPIGTIASHIFALKDFQWNGCPLIDVLIAKFHVVCPVLFGIYGPENTAAGMLRLGWVREGDSFTGLREHSQRMAGLGAGYAAISLRNYEKAAHQNPFPATNYWIAFANILNVPQGQRTDTHALVLKAMIEGYEERFLLFYGDAARCALGMAIREFPRGYAGKDGAVGMKSLELMGDLVLRERKIRI